MRKPLIIIGFVVIVLLSIFILGNIAGGSFKARGVQTEALSDQLAYDLAEPQAKMERQSEMSEQTVSEEKLIRNVSYDLRSKEFEADLDFLKALPAQFGGRIETMDQGIRGASGQELQYFRGSFRIPTDRLEDFMSALEKDRIIEHKAYNQYSVTDQYNRSEARLKTLEATQTRYLELLAKAEQVSDILAIETELTNVQSEIEWLTNSLASYDKDMDYTLVEVQLREIGSHQALSGPSLWDELRDAFVSGIASFILGVKILILLLIRIWPILLLMAIGVGIYFGRRKRKKTQE